MGRPYSQDLRERVIAVVDGGSGVTATSRLLRLSVSYVSKVMGRRNATGETTARALGRGPRPKLADHHETLRRRVAEVPDETLEELRAWLLAEHSVSISVGRLCTTLHGLKLTRKKTLHAAEQERPDVAAARTAWRAAQPALNPTKLVFIDETWASTNMVRRYGRAPRGQRCLASVPHGHWLTATFVAGLRHDGLVAPCVLDGPIDGQSFRAWVEQFLAPTLRPGNTVIMDNLGSHKVDGVRQAIEAAGARLFYLPPYSPDLNPIEKLFAKLKAFLRKTAARSFPALFDAFASALTHFLPDECANYFHAAGYSR